MDHETLAVGGRQSSGPFRNQALLRLAIAGADVWLWASSHPHLPGSAPDPESLSTNLCMARFISWYLGIRDGALPHKCEWLEAHSETTALSIASRMSAARVGIEELERFGEGTT